MEKCNTCFYQEKLYDNSLICQHIQSMRGLEAIEQFKQCDDVTKCEFYKETNFKCSDCSGNCYINQTENKCRKMEVIKMKKALIVVDMQTDFVTGSLGSKEAQEIVPNIKAKIDEYMNDNHRIIFTRDTHRENYLETFEGKNLPVEHCIMGTEGWQIVPELRDCCRFYPACEGVNKLTFGYEGWKQLFGDVEEYEIELVGVCTDICVISNALALRMMYPSWNITVDASCCAGVTPEKHKAALEVMKSCQINVIGEQI